MSATTCATSRPAHAAGMPTIAAAYGYCGDGVPPERWQAQHFAATTKGLRELLRNVAL